MFVCFGWERFFLSSTSFFFPRVLSLLWLRAIQTPACHSTFKPNWQLWLAAQIWIVTAGVHFVQQGSETEHTSINWPATVKALSHSEPYKWPWPQKFFFFSFWAILWVYMLIQNPNEWLILYFENTVVWNQNKKRRPDACLSTEQSRGSIKSLFSPSRLKMCGGKMVGNELN